MVDLEVTDVIHNGSQGSMTSSVMETMLNSCSAMFSVRHLLDVRDQKDLMCHLPPPPPPQQQQVDDAEVSDPAEGQIQSQLDSVTHDDPSMPAMACLVTGGEMSPSTGTASPPPRHGGYDMPDLVQDSEMMASYDHDNMTCVRWLPSNTSLDCYTGRV